MYSTSPAGYDLIKRFEGCEKRLPNGLLAAYKIGPDPWTIAWGQTGRMPDGRPVVEGLTVTQQEADEALEWYVRNVVDPLVRKHFNARTQSEHDALASWVYNLSHAKLEAGKYSLPDLVNLKERDLNAVIDKWVQYVNPGTIFEQGLFRRRLAELCLFLGLPWHLALTATLKRKNGVVVARTDPYYVIDMAEMAAEKTEDDVTADLNAAQLEKLGGKPAAPSVKPVTAKKAAPVPAAPKAAEAPPAPPVAPQVDAALPPKPMEQSKTHVGLSKKESGQEAVIVGTTVTGIGALLPNINALTTYLEKFPVKTILMSLAVVGVGIILVGLWRWWVGRMIAYEGRRDAQQTKV